MLLAEKLLEIDILEGCKDTKGLSEATMATKTILLHITYSHMKVYVDIQMRVMPAFSFSVFKGVSFYCSHSLSKTPLRNPQCQGQAFLPRVFCGDNSVSRGCLSTGAIL